MIHDPPSIQESFFMPVRLGSKHLPESAEARIEIIPLIDIMFFLLASFMLVSLSMVNLKSMKVNLPTATTATPESKRDFADISVDKSGGIYLDKKPMGSHELIAALAAAKAANPNLRVFISGDEDARNGDMVRALDAVRSAGIDKVAFETRNPEKAAQP
jgi:biopolymer transport protein ExbD